MLHSHLRTLSPTFMAVALLAACGDSHPTGSADSTVAAPTGGRPLHSVTQPFLTEQDAFRNC